MTTYMVQPGDYPSSLAAQFTGDARRWPELCAANPQLKKDTKAGCAIYANHSINLPASWGTGTVAAPTGERPAAEFVYVPPGTTTAAAPAVVKLAATTAAMVGAGVPAPAAASPISKRQVSWIKWSLLGGSVIAVGGVVAWLMLRNQDDTTRKNGGIMAWVQHKIGTAPAKPRANRRGSRRKAKRGAD
jgi:hypothetical protein